MKPSKKKPQMKDVHFIFSHHPPGQKYHPRGTPSKETHTVLIEAYKGTPAETIFSHLEKRPGEGRRQSQYSFQKKARKRGVKVRTGEEPITPTQKKKFKILLDKRIRANERYSSNPTLQNYILFITAFSKHMAYRNELIKEKIREAKGKNRVEAIYGRTHSTLRWDLKKEGIQSSAEMNQRLMPYHARILRIMAIGKKPTISDYRKAMISHALEAKLWEEQTVKKLFGVEKINDRHVRLLDILSSALIDNLSTAQIISLTRNLSLEKLFELNELRPPWNINESERRQYRREINNFLKKHSEFYKFILASGKKV